MRVPKKFDADALRVFACIFIPILFYFMYKYYKRNYGPNAKKKVTLKGNWVKN